MFAKSIVFLAAACAAFLPVHLVPTVDAAPAIFQGNFLRPEAGPLGFFPRSRRNTSPVVPRGSLSRRDDLDATCDALFGSGFTSPAPGQPLFASGDSWIQGFQAPETGSICQLTIGTAPEPNVTVVAQLSLYNSSSDQNDILNGNATPFASANATLEPLSTLLTFVFCGDNSAPITSGQAVTLVVSLETVSPASGSLVLNFQQAAAFGLFFGPTYPQHELLNQGLQFNITLSSSNGTACQTTSTTTTTTTATATASTTASTTSVSFTITSDVTTTSTVTGTVSPSSTTSSATPTSSNTCRVRDTSSCPMDGAWDSCGSASDYTACVNSPTLSLCKVIACSNPNDLSLRLKACADLDAAARANVGGGTLIPCRW